MPGNGALRLFGAVLVAASLHGPASTAEARPAPGAKSVPGTLLEYQPLPNAPDGAAAYQVLYRSTGLRGEPIAVSRAIIVPAGPVPSGGRSVVAWRTQPPASSKNVRPRSPACSTARSRA